MRGSLQKYRVIDHVITHLEVFLLIIISINVDIIAPTRDLDIFSTESRTVDLL